MALALPLVGWAATAYASLVSSKKEQSRAVLEKAADLNSAGNNSAETLSSARSLVQHTWSEFPWLHKLVGVSPKYYGTSNLH